MTREWGKEKQPEPHHGQPQRRQVRSIPANRNYTTGASRMDHGSHMTGLLNLKNACLLEGIITDQCSRFMLTNAIGRSGDLAPWRNFDRPEHEYYTLTAP